MPECVVGDSEQTHENKRFERSRHPNHKHLESSKRSKRIRRDCCAPARTQLPLSMNSRRIFCIPTRPTVRFVEKLKTPPDKYGTVADGFNVNLPLGGDCYFGGEPVRHGLGVRHPAKHC